MEKKLLNIRIMLVIIILFIGTSFTPKINADIKTFNFEIKAKSIETHTLTDTIPPSITINFAGNPSDKGGPYWRPPGENIPAADGYYTNDSKQIEGWIYINCTITDSDGVNQVWLHWLNESSWLNNTYYFSNSGGDYWEFNSSGKITTAEGYNYSFDIWANDINGNSALIQWNKTGPSPPLEQVFTRRYIHLNCTPTNINYVPYYFYNATYLSGNNWYNGGSKRDRLHHDQGQDGSLHDTGYLLDDIPNDTIYFRYCNLFVGYWFDESVCIQPNIIDNIYHHFWWKTDGDPLKVGYKKTRGELYSIQGFDKFYKTNFSNAASNITLTLGTPGSNGVYYLESHLFKLSPPPSIGDNDIYEISLKMDTGDPHLSTRNQQNPFVVSNRSFTSFVLFNVPDNATLNATYNDSDEDDLTDWTELYITYTNPFLVDTDNDGVSDYDENLSGSDPNNYTDTIMPIPSIVYVDDDYDENTPGWQVDHFDKIQDGIEVIDERGDVYVYNGTYYEDITINKALSLISEDKLTTIIKGSLLVGPADISVVTVSADDVVIIGFTIHNRRDESDAHGIKVLSDYNIISGNVIKDNNGHGIYFKGGSNNNVTENTIEDNNYGICYDRYSNYNKVWKNNFIDNNVQAYDPSGDPQFSPEETHTIGNQWTGNYWSDYPYPDVNPPELCICPDGRGENPWPIPGGISEDKRPYIHIYGWTRTYGCGGRLPQEKTLEPTEPQPHP